MHVLRNVNSCHSLLSRFIVPAGRKQSDHTWRINGASSFDAAPDRIWDALNFLHGKEKNELDKKNLRNFSKTLFKSFKSLQEFEGKLCEFKQHYGSLLFLIKEII